MNTLLLIVITLLLLSVLVVVHEFGHFIAARKIGVTVEEFAVGMGPAFFKKQGKETLFSLRIFPLGGFCKMKGEEVEEDENGEVIFIPDDDPGSFANRTKGERLIILAAGALMNILFAFLILLVIFTIRDHSLFTGLQQAAITLVNFAGAVYQSLYMLIKGQLGLNDFTGPVGMVSMVGQFVAYGPVTLALFTALISVNLGVMNLLPLPALDGGQILILLIEKIIRRDLDPKKRTLINFIGFAALMTLAVVIAVNDVLRMVG